MTLPERCCDATACLADEFKVPIDIAHRRLEQIRRRVYAGRFFAAVSDQGNSSLLKEGVQIPY